MNAKPKAVGCYVRVSTIGQNESGQRAEIDRWLAGNGVDPAAVRWFVDKKTGDNLNRPAFEQLQAAIFSGAIGTVVVYKLDRLSRSLRDGINVLSEWCDRGMRRSYLRRSRSTSTGHSARCWRQCCSASRRWSRRPDASDRRQESRWRRRKASIAAASLARRRPSPLGLSSYATEGLHRRGDLHVAGSLPQHRVSLPARRSDRPLISGGALDRAHHCIRDLECSLGDRFGLARPLSFGRADNTLQSESSVPLAQRYPFVFSGRIDRHFGVSRHLASPDWIFGLIIDPVDSPGARFCKGVASSQLVSLMRRQGRSSRAAFSFSVRAELSPE